MNMDTAGPPTISQLFAWIDKAETGPANRERLFEPFGGPRSAVIRGLTSKVLEFVVSEWDSLNNSSDSKLPVEDSSYSYVCSFQVLEHVPIPQDYLHEAYRILRTGGKLFITTHGLWPYHPTPEDHHRWTRDGLIYELGKAGFDVCFADHILNVYSAAVEFFVMNVDYRGRWGRFRWLVHLLTNMAIWVLERRECDIPQIPAVLCVLGVKR